MYEPSSFYSMCTFVSVRVCSHVVSAWTWAATSWLRSLCRRICLRNFRSSTWPETLVSTWTTRPSSSSSMLLFILQYDYNLHFGVSSSFLFFCYGPSVRSKLLSSKLIDNQNQLLMNSLNRFLSIACVSLFFHNSELNLFHVLVFFSNIRCFRIDPPPTFSSSETSGGPAVWSHGYTEASGVKNKWVQSVNDKKHTHTTAITVVQWSLTNLNLLRMCTVEVGWLKWRKSLRSAYWKHKALTVTC